ncbi:hypothetical protein CROQUDRAFT_715737 [Cronartium quercuum f. sp. fusiforme G11]|uniref:Uncharacterized protein n=1 Tax=Cronartium quercuum f. sp. fusiforme G11 TaxID=708437 RepID=A0A9P6NLA9_9BASI|nr:hypothetical protein CROQUDRAFT_715737 [Cronartium quercuum f. sp. fusiforme G11]
MLLRSRAAFQTLLLVALVAFDRHANATPMESLKETSAIANEILFDHNDYGLKFQPGNEFRAAVNSFHEEYKEAGKDDLLETFTYNKGPDPEPTQMEVDKGPLTEEKIKELQEKNARRILEVGKYKNIDKIIQDSRAQTELYLKNMASGNENDNFSLILNGEGPDYPAAMTMIYKVGRAPKHIFLNSRTLPPKAPPEEFEKALTALASTEKFKQQTMPKLKMISDLEYESFANSIADRIKETSQPYHLVVFGNGIPIVNLFEQDSLKAHLENVFVSHVASFFWKEQDDRIVWPLAFNSKEKPDIEKKILNSGVRRLVTHSNGIKSNFINMMDANQATLFLKDHPEINFNWEQKGGVEGMNLYFGPNSPSEIGRHLGKAMEKSMQSIQKKKLEEREKVEQATKFFKGLSDEERTNLAVLDVLQAAREKNDKIFDSSLNVVEYWNSIGGDALEEACTQLINFERPGDLWFKKTLSNREKAHLKDAMREKIRGEDGPTYLRLQLLSGALQNHDLEYQVHSNDAHSVLPFIKQSKEPMNHVLALPVGLKKEANSAKGELNLQFDPNSKTLSAVWANSEAVKDTWAQAFTEGTK